MPMLLPSKNKGGPSAFHNPRDEIGCVIVLEPPRPPPVWWRLEVSGCADEYSRSAGPDRGRGTDDPDRLGCDHARDRGADHRRDPCLRVLVSGVEPARHIPADLNLFRAHRAGGMVDPRPDDHPARWRGLDRLASA